MKIIQINGNVVVNMIDTRDDTTNENIAVVGDIPEFKPLDGYNGILKYNSDTGLYWDYVEVPVSNEISNDEFMSMIQEVL